MNDFRPLLSAAGERRRKQILDLALMEARGRRGRRALVRVALAGSFVAALAFMILRPRLPQHADIAVKPSRSHSEKVEKPLVFVTRIETDPHIIERLTIPPQPSHVFVINDDELLTSLAMAHRPAGLAYLNGKAMLLFR